MQVLNLRIIARTLSIIAAGSGVAFLPSIGWAAYYAEWWTIPPIFAASCIAWTVAALLYGIGRKADNQLYQREALAIVVFSWVLSGVLGALPFVCSGLLEPVGAVFECVSGYTTTGASVVDNLAEWPHSLLFWRSFTHWLGGIGIVVMFMAILPYLAASGKLLFMTESSGPDPRGLRPHLRDTALVLLQIYIVLTLLNTAAYLLTGKMDLFDSLCHAFGTLATGGFSTRQESIYYYQSLPVELVTILFMVCGASSFGLYLALVQGDRLAFFRSTEWRAMIGVLAAATLLAATNVAGFWGAAPAGQPALETQESPGFWHSLRVAAFSVTSLMTNTGYVTEDYDAWPFFSRMLLVVVMCIGGSAGSTAGGMKVVRIVMVFKMLRNRLERLFRPYTVRALRVDNEVIDDTVQRNVLLFVLAYLLCLGGCSLVMSAFGLPFDSAVSAVATCMSNTGPGLGLVGGMETCSIVPPGGQVFLVFCMILGRLEVLAVLVLFMPGFWRSK